MPLTSKAKEAVVVPIPTLPVVVFINTELLHEGAAEPCPTRRYPEDPAEVAEIAEVPLP